MLQSIQESYPICLAPQDTPHIYPNTPDSLKPFLTISPYSVSPVLSLNLANLLPQ